MKKSLLVIFEARVLVGIVYVLFFIGVNIGHATTICNLSGNSADCTDSSGQGTTYNQYGNTIYGSDGSTATIYNDPVYDMGPGLPSVSTAGIDMNSPVMKEAQAKYDEACDSSAGFNGGAQARDCRTAVVEWLQALSDAPKISSSNDYEAEEDDYSDDSDTGDDDMDQFLEDMESIVNGTYGTQSTNSCVSNGYLNTHLENNRCVCDAGFVYTINKGCIPGDTDEFCPLMNAIPRGTENCACQPGYTFTKINKREIFDISGILYPIDYKCIQNSVPKETSTPIEKKETNNKITEGNFEVTSGDISLLSQTGNINTEAKLRQCPSTQCSEIGSYPKGTVVEIMGIYKNDTWFKVNVINSKEGWMHQSLVDTVVKQAELGGDTSEPIKMTRDEYEAKFGVPVPDEVKVEPVKGKVSLWKKIISWFGF